MSDGNALVPADPATISNDQMTALQADGHSAYWKGPMASKYQAVALERAELKVQAEANAETRNAPLPSRVGGVDQQGFPVDPAPDTKGFHPPAFVREALSIDADGRALVAAWEGGGGFEQNLHDAQMYATEFLSVASRDDAAYVMAKVEDDPRMRNILFHLLQQHGARKR